MRFIKYFIYYNFALIKHVSIFTYCLVSLFLIDYPTDDFLPFILYIIGTVWALVSFLFGETDSGSNLYNLTDLRIKDIKIRAFMDKVKFKGGEFTYKGLVFYKLSKWESSRTDHGRMITNSYLYTKYKKFKKNKINKEINNNNNNDNNDNIDIGDLRNLTNEEKAKKIMEAYPNSGYYTYNRYL